MILNWPASYNYANLDTYEMVKKNDCDFDFTI